MCIKVSLPDKESLEILFLESSQPKADVSKFLLDWVKLVCMCKDAHVQMFNTITKDQELNWVCLRVVKHFWNKWVLCLS